MASFIGSVIFNEVENSTSAWEVGLVMAMPPNLAGKVNTLCISSSGGGWPVNVGMSLTLIIDSKG